MPDMTKHHKNPCANCDHRDLHGEVSGCIAMASVSPDRWCDCTTYVAPAIAPARAAHQRTRATDPSTSMAAAASITVADLRESQAAVLKFIQENGPMTDAALVEDYPQHADDMPRQSQSGLRTRRAELAAGGLVEDTGERATLASGRKAIVWASKA